MGGTDGLTVSTGDLASAGSQVASANEPASRCASTIAGVESVVGTPQVGTGIGAAATAFCVSLAARCTGLSASAADQGDAIAGAALLYTAADDDAASGFNYAASLAI